MRSISLVKESEATCCHQEESDYLGILLFAVLSVAVGNFIPHEVHHHPQPYKFGYSVKDKHGEQHREESGDGGHGVKGSYGFSDNRGVHRQVNYVADHGGFRAEVKTNEPGTANQDPAAVKMISSAHNGYGGYGLGSGVYGGGYGGEGQYYGGYGHGYGGYGVGNGGYALGYGGYGAGNGAYGLGYGGYGIAAGLLGGYGYGTVGMDRFGYKYDGPLHGGHVSVYNSMHGHY